MAQTQAELAADLEALTQQGVKIGTEVTALKTKVADLETAIANGPAVTQDVQDKLAALKTQMQVVDDLVPDALPS